MIETMHAQIAFGIWALISLGLYINSFPLQNLFGKILSATLSIVCGMMLYTLHWEAYFWFVLIVVPASSAITQITYKKPPKLGTGGVILLIAFVYAYNYGSYFLIEWLNIPQ